MSNTLLEQLSKAKTGDEADAIILEARRLWEDHGNQMRKLADGHKPGNIESHSKFQKLFANYLSTGAVLEVLSDDPERTFFWHMGNAAIDVEQPNESDYAKLLRLESTVIQLGFAVQSLFVLIKEPEVLKAIKHLMEADALSARGEPK